MENNIKEPIYLDNAATTRLDDEVLKAMLPYLTTHYGNPSSLHSSGRRARMALEEARKKIAGLLGVKPSSIVFTSGGTESNNMAILTALRDLHCTHIITSKIEHHAVLHTIDYYSQKLGREVSYVNVYEDGSIDQNDFRRILERKAKEGEKCLVSLMHANNETGQFTEIGWIGSLCRRYNAIFHCDCVTTIGHYPLNLSKVKVDLASASAHKFHGTKGVGFLYVREDLSVGPLLLGGSQERGYRAGTEQVAGIVGMAKALQLSYEGFARHEQAITEVKQYLATLLKHHFPDLVINSGRFSLYSVLSVSFPRSEQSEFLLLALDQRGVCVSGGSACSGGGSHVMKVLGKTDQFVTIRFSFSKYNSKEEVERVVALVKEILQPQTHSSLITE